jgi:hypothetical protein
VLLAEGDHFFRRAPSLVSRFSQVAGARSGSDHNPICFCFEIRALSPFRAALGMVLMFPLALLE